MVRGSTGAHVAVRRERIGNRGALTLLSPTDGRVMFVLPEGSLAVIGTTETATVVSPDDVRATARDVAYLLGSANRFFPAAQLTEADVVSAWGGIRPLAAASAPGELGSASREHAIGRGPTGVITITGGKLTTYRVMAAEVVDEVEHDLGRRPSRAPTSNTALPGGDVLSTDAAITAARDATGAEDIARRLVHAYGSAWREVWDRAASTSGGKTRIASELPYVLGEMVYSAERELACTLGDLLIRRTRIAFETVDHGWSTAPQIADTVAAVLGWDARRIGVELGRLREELDRIFSIE
jgi:glycerol-3-phosphate dehydrogenase